MSIFAGAFGIAEKRLDPEFAARDEDPDLSGYLSPSGTRVSSTSAMSLSTFWRCVDLISGTVGLAPTSVVVKAGGRSFPEYGPKPSWMVGPDPSQPNYTTADYFAEATLSLLIDGNFFTVVAPSVANPQVLRLMDPRRIKVRPPNAQEEDLGVSGVRYDVLSTTGQVLATLGADQMLHGWWVRMPGDLRGLSPLEALRRGFGAAIAADDFAARYFGQGAALSFGVEVPGALSEEQKHDLRDQLRHRHAGLSNSHAIGVLTQGAKFVGGLAPTPEQSQMLQTRKFAVEDVARVFGVPPGMVGSQEPGSSSYASAVEWRRQFRDDSVLKFTTKLERQHNRLVSLPDGFTGASDAQAEIVFNLDWVARTDMLARFQAYGEAVQKGFKTPNEVRSDEGLPPQKGGDTLYMQQQMVPIADTGHTKLTEPMVGQDPAGTGPAKQSGSGTF